MHEPLPLMKWHGSHNGRNTVRLSLSFGGIFPQRRTTARHIPKNRKEGQGLRSIGRAGGLLTEKRKNFPFTPF